MSVDTEPPSISGDAVNPASPDNTDTVNLQATVTGQGITPNNPYACWWNVTDDDGDSAIASVDIVVVNRPPVAMAVIDKTEMIVGETVNLDASNSTDDPWDAWIDFPVCWSWIWDMDAKTLRRGAKNCNKRCFGSYVFCYAWHVHPIYCSYSLCNI